MYYQLDKGHYDQRRVLAFFQALLIENYENYENCLSSKREIEKSHLLYFNESLIIYERDIYCCTYNSNNHNNNCEFNFLVKCNISQNLKQTKFVYSFEVLKSCIKLNFFFFFSLIQKLNSDNEFLLSKCLSSDTKMTKCFHYKLKNIFSILWHNFATLKWNGCLHSYDYCRIGVTTHKKAINTDNLIQNRSNFLYIFSEML